MARNRLSLFWIRFRQESKEEGRILQSGINGQRRFHSCRVVRTPYLERFRRECSAYPQTYFFVLLDGYGIVRADVPFIRDRNPVSNK